jgi:8-hydroxy-5-deazaflavin:NADPH oxidoreductase
MSFDPRTLPDVSALTVGILGGTGDQGRGLAYRLAVAGQSIVVGSRSRERGQQVAADLNGMPGITTAVRGGDNQAAADADLVIVATPWEGHAATLAEFRSPLSGKIVVDCVNPLGFDSRGPYPLPVPEGSAAEQAAALLPDSRVCAAFHHVSAVLLTDPEVVEVELDVMVLSEDREAAATVQALAGRIPRMRGIYAGRLRNAGQVEALTANLIAINRRYRAHSAIRITHL